MPEPDDGTEVPETKEKNTKILDFFKPVVKESKKDKSKPLTKIVVRRLPPRLTKDVFLTEFNLPAHDYFHFVRGNLSLGIHSFSRAYFNCTNVDDTFAFKEKYDDHPVTDEHGKEYHAVVEWAPVQRVPKKSAQKKKIPKSGTIESDSKYIEFLQKLEQEKNSPVNSTEYFLETDNTLTKDTKITTTPLLEFIKMKRQRKIDLRNENRLKKKEAEKERRRKEDELRRAEKSRKFKEDKDTKSKKVEEKVEDFKEEKEAKGKQKEDEDLKTEQEDRKTKKEKRLEHNKKEKIVTKSSTPKEEIKKNLPNKEAVEEPKGKVSEPSVKKSNPSPRKAAEPRPEPKSKFRYSEQRNRDREMRNQKLDAKKQTADGEKVVEDVKEAKEEPRLQRSVSDCSNEDGDERSGRDPRTERRIRNKDRPAMEIYRPGMGKFSKQRLEQKPDTGKGSGGSGKTSPESDSMKGSEKTREDSIEEKTVDNLVDEVKNLDIVEKNDDPNVAAVEDNEESSLAHLGKVALILAAFLFLMRLWRR